MKGLEEGRSVCHPTLRPVDLTYIALVPQGRLDLILMASMPRPADGETWS